MTFLGVPTSMTLNDIEIVKIGGFSEFVNISGCNTHLKGEFLPKLLEIDQDNLRMKLN